MFMPRVNSSNLPERFDDPHEAESTIHEETYIGSHTLQTKYQFGLV